MEFSIKHTSKDAKKGKFYLEKAHEKVAHSEYRMEDDNTIVIERTEVIPSFQGTGTGKQLVDKVLRFSESENMKLKSECEYFSHQWEKMKGNDSS